MRAAVYRRRATRTECCMPVVCCLTLLHARRMLSDTVACAPSRRATGPRSCEVPRASTAEEQQDVLFEAARGIGLKQLTA